MGLPEDFKSLRCYPPATDSMWIQDDKDRDRDSDRDSAMEFRVL